MYGEVGAGIISAMYLQGISSETPIYCGSLSTCKICFHISHKKTLRLTLEGIS